MAGRVRAPRCVCASLGGTTDETLSLRCRHQLLQLADAPSGCLARLDAVHLALEVVPALLALGAPRVVALGVLPAVIEAGVSDELSDPLLVPGRRLPDEVAPVLVGTADTAAGRAAAARSRRTRQPPGQGGSVRPSGSLLTPCDALEVVAQRATCQHGVAARPVDIEVGSRPEATSVVRRAHDAAGCRCCESSQLRTSAAA